LAGELHQAQAKPERSGIVQRVQIATRIPFSSCRISQLFARGNINAAGAAVAASTYRVNSELTFPVTGSGRDKLGFAVRQARFATTLRDWEPAEFRLREQFVEVFAQSTPVSEVFDTEGREAMIHSGTAVQHLKLTLKQHGCLGRVDLFPDLDQPNLTARVHLGSGGARDDFERELFKATEAGEGLQQLPAPISDATLVWLSRVATGERSWLEFARSEGSRQRLVKLIQETKRVRMAEIQVRNESPVRSANAGWGLSRLTSGMLPERFARWRKPSLAIKVRETVVPSQEPFEPNQPALMEGTFAVLKTKTDEKHGWLAAGQTLAQLLLLVRTLGLPCTPYVDVLRQPERRAELRTTIGHKGFTQVILRFDAPRIESPVRSVATDPITETRPSV
jgi:hypothetical protein